MILPSSPVDKFLSYLKQETGKEVCLMDAVFHRDFAKYRHRRYPDSAVDTWKSDFMVRTWINVILREGLSDELRLTLFPGSFDLGHISSDNGESGRLADLIADLNSRSSGPEGSLVKKDLRTTVNWIKKTIGHDLSDSKLCYPRTSLKVIKLLHNMAKNRKARLLGFISPPLKKATLEFSDTAVGPMNEEDSLIVADLISYLSVEIPEERLNSIHVQLIKSSSLLRRVALENKRITAPIHAHHSGDSYQIAAAYHELAEYIEEYHPTRLIAPSNPLDETLYVYLRTLEFQHFVGEYEEIVEKSLAVDEIHDIRIEIADLCTALNEEWNVNISPLSAEMSINQFPDFVGKYQKKFRQIIRSATGLSVRPDEFDEVVHHASKILSMYSWCFFGEKNLDAIVISVSDCIAALCVVRHQQARKTKHLPYVFGLKQSAKSPLRFFSKDKSIKELHETDYIPHGINELMYRRFCHIHACMIGSGERHDAFLRFDIARLKKYVECLQSYDIDSINLSIKKFNADCSMVAAMCSLAPAIGKWLSYD